ncbi:MAG: DUF202 domain-containing protein [Defluviitaleaceae bacterium]|nr:DUF202 domain-containing protein [Defluviitaleaceae bacterium]
MDDNQQKHTHMTMRDYLAMDRTKMANDRTFLAYMRTFISILAAGVGFIRFVEVSGVKYIGIVLCFVSTIFLVVGVYKYIVMKRKIGKFDS